MPELLASGVEAPQRAKDSRIDLGMDWSALESSTLGSSETAGVSWGLKLAEKIQEKLERVCQTS